MRERAEREEDNRDKEGGCVSVCEREKQERREGVSERKGKTINPPDINTTPYSALQDRSPFSSKLIGITIHTASSIYSGATSL